MTRTDHQSDCVCRTALSSWQPPRRAARQICSGVTGISRWVTPRSASASTTARPTTRGRSSFSNEASDPKNGVDPKMTNHMDKLEWLQDELIKAANLTQRFDLSRVVNTEVGAEARKRAGLQD
jgi:hypothetical protein